MENQTDFYKTIKNLMLLDAESLLLIDSGVKLLLARQKMGSSLDEDEKNSGFEQPRNPTM